MEYDHINKVVLEGKIEQLENIKPEFVGTAFVSIENSEHVKYIVKKYRKQSVAQWFTRFRRKRLYTSLKEFHGQKVVIEKAPEPSDIIWENQGYRAKDNIKSESLIRTQSGDNPEITKNTRNQF